MAHNRSDGKTMNLVEFPDLLFGVGSATSAEKRIQVPREHRYDCLPGKVSLFRNISIMIFRLKKVPALFCSERSVNAMMTTMITASILLSDDSPR